MIYIYMYMQDTFQKLMTLFQGACYNETERPVEVGRTIVVDFDMCFIIIQYNRLRIIKFFLYLHNTSVM